MTTKHTPGPWHIYDYERTENEPFSRYQIRNAGGEPVAMGSNYGDFGVFAWTSETKLANARLIAAAPDLLEALEKSEEALMACLKNSDALGGLLPLIRAAIGKARGEG